MLELEKQKDQVAPRLPDQYYSGADVAARKKALISALKNSSTADSEKAADRILKEYSSPDSI